MVYRRVRAFLLLRHVATLRGKHVQTWFMSSQTCIARGQSSVAAFMLAGIHLYGFVGNNRTTMVPSDQ